MKPKSKNITPRLYSIASILFIILVWKLLSLRFNSEFILPSPENTLLSAIRLFADAGFLKTVGATVLRGLIGFALAATMGICLGIPAGIHENFSAFLSPILVVMRSIPVVAFILLALIWLSSDNVPVIIALLTMFPLICNNVAEGIKNIDKGLLEMASLYKVPHIRRISGVYIPAVTPHILSGFSSAMGIGWRAIIVGEVLSQPQWGIGTVMHTAQTFLQVDVLIAWTLIAILISYLFEYLIRLISRTLTRIPS